MFDGGERSLHINADDIDSEETVPCLSIIASFLSLSRNLS
jgi:hypothetical protein